MRLKKEVARQEAELKRLHTLLDKTLAREEMAREQEPIILVEADAFRPLVKIEKKMMQCHANLLDSYSVRSYMQPCAPLRS